MRREENLKVAMMNDERVIKHSDRGRNEMQ